MQPSLPFDSPRCHDERLAQGEPLYPSVLPDGPLNLDPTNLPDPRDPSALVPSTQRAPLFVRHRRAKRYLLRVTPDGTVRVTIPRGGSKREAAAFAEREHAWIEQQQRRVEAQRLVRTEEEERGERPSAVEVRALREQAKRQLPVRLLELAAQHGLAVSRISIRNQRSRWGSCSRSGHICLNWRLVQMPAMVRDYVLIHELMHLKRMDHSAAFWKLVAAACPAYKKARAWLRSQGAR
jgi:predicted metal-dependent hydrolase